MKKTKIIEWMDQKVDQAGFIDAADLAKQFLEEHHIQDSLSDDFLNTLDAAFEIAGKIHGFDTDYPTNSSSGF